MNTHILGYMQQHGYKKLQLCNDTASGLRAVIAIHSTALGPAVGGLRMWTYPDEQAAIMDALRLARGMTYKYAAAGADLGGAERRSSSATPGGTRPRRCCAPWGG